MTVRLRGAVGEIPALMNRISNPGLEAGTLVSVEPTLGYHSWFTNVLT